MNEIFAMSWLLVGHLVRGPSCWMSCRCIVSCTRKYFRVSNVDTLAVPRMVPFLAHIPGCFPRRRKIYHISPRSFGQMLSRAVRLFFTLRLPTTVRVSRETRTRGEVGPYKERQLAPGFTRQSRAREGSSSTVDFLNIFSQAKTLVPTKVNRNNTRGFLASGRLLRPAAGIVLLRDRYHRESEKLGRDMY